MRASTAIALTKLDVLDGFERIEVVVGYELPDGSRLETVPPDLELLGRVRPVTESLPGWKGATAGLTDEAGLPSAARDYLAFLEQRLGVPIVLVSTGPRREETMARGDSEVAARVAGLLTPA